jgi:hypothetical protein
MLIRGFDANREFDEDLALLLNRGFQENLGLGVKLGSW